MAETIRPPTLRDVAAAAGVSVPTASRVLAQKREFSSSTRERVFVAAETLGYSRGWTSQGRPSAESTAVDLAVGRVSPQWTDRVISGAWQAAARRGLDLSILVESASGDDDWVERVARRHSLGAVFGLVQPSRSQLEHLRRMRLPVVLLAPLSDSQVGVPRVEATDRDGGYAAGRHLASLGVSRFVAVLGRPAYSFGRAREAGFRSAVPGTHPVTTITVGWHGRGVIPELVKLLTNDCPPVGVFATNDAVALRCYESAAAAGLRVGHDVLVVGFDDEPAAAHASPSLTTVRQPIEAMAARAIEILADAAAAGEHPQPVREQLRTRLVVRESTSPS